MDCHQYITDRPERKSGQHLQREERGAIQALKRQGLSNRAIARELGCSPTTIGNELRRGTPPRKSNKGRAPGYSAKRGEAVYRSNRLRSRKPHKLHSCSAFVTWVTTQIREHNWSLDACVGYPKRHGLFSANEMVCTHTLYNEAWAGNLPIEIMELPEAVKRKHSQSSIPRKNKKNFGKSIDLRPEVASQRTEEGHWEGDTVVGKRAGKEAVVFSLLEKKTASHKCSRLLQLTTVLSFRTLLSVKAGEPKCTSPIPILHGNGLRTSVTTGCSVPLFPRELPCRTTLLSTSCRLRMS